ncbi:hypothetical protein QCA50_004489 [Cerrena zonata]|uniref:Uncharacterized protein n=1 Tax=Cerrena zonata TaxID=2478898 RepID=A0AAW0GP73_9APHY
MDFINLVRSLRDQPGFRVLFSVTGITSHFPGLGPGLSIGSELQMSNYREFERFGTDVINAPSIVYILIPLQLKPDSGVGTPVCGNVLLHC